MQQGGKMINIPQTESLIRSTEQSTQYVAAYYQKGIRFLEDFKNLQHRSSWSQAFYWIAAVEYLEKFFIAALEDLEKFFFSKVVIQSFKKLFWKMLKY